MNEFDPITSPEITDRAHPPRFRWTKRIGKWVAGLLFLLFIARPGWGYVAEKRLKAALDAIAANGDPVYPYQLQPPAVPDEENAALVWQKAIDALNGNVETPAASNLSYNEYPPYPPKWYRLLESGVAGNAKSIALARKASSLPGVDWHLTISSPMMPAVQPFGRQRELANILTDSALHAHLHGNDAEAIARIEDVHNLGYSISQQPYVISYLVAVAIDSLAIERLEQITAELRIESKSSLSGIQPATRVQVKNLIDKLIAESDDSAPYRRVMVIARVENLDAFFTVTDRSWVLRPMFKLDLLRSTKALNLLVLGSDAPNEPKARAIASPMSAYLPPKPSSASGSINRTPVSRLFTSWLAPTGELRLLTIEFNCRTGLRFAAIGLAIRMYHSDHDAWPENLDALVPTYLPRVPSDLFSASDKPMGYFLIKHGLPDDGDRPILYSVGERGDGPVDPATAPTVPSFGRPRGPVRFRDVTMWTPKNPTTFPADDGQP